ncbi:MAG: rhodanese-like domain-containing protein [Anaerolineales bacterium]|nr:MAG: rhodanese-like domain-containing protein [Anaerolineales bacterium]
MFKKFQLPLALFLALSLILSACGAPAPVAEPIVEAPVEEPAAPVVEEPEMGMAQMFAGFITNLPAEQKFYSVTAADLNQMLAENAPFIVDVRQASELEANGYIEGSIHVEIRELLKNLDKLPGKDAKIVVVCASGHRGGYAMVALRLLGYTDVFNLNGGMGAWKKAEFAVVEGMPEAAASISTPDVDAIRLAYFDKYLSNLDPAAGFGSVKNDGLNTELVEGKELFLLDVRRQAEWDENGYIDGAVLVPLNSLPASLDQLPADKDAAIVVICATGHRGTPAQMYLQELGYTNVRNLNGGMNGWKGAGFPVVGVVDWPAVFSDFITNLPAEQKFYSVTAADLNQMLAENAPFIVDVRQASELEANGYIEGSIHVEIRELLKNLDKLPGKDAKIVVVCASGHRGGYAMVALRLLGYTDVFNLNGGMGAWKKAEFAVVEGMPEAAASISTPDVDAIRLAYFDKYLSNLDPAAGFGSVKNDGLNTELVEGKELFLLDVRRQAEWDENGYIDGAVLVPLNSLPASLDQLPADKDAAIVVICATGHRGTPAQMYLQELGYTNVRNLNGGMNGWIGAELPIVK